MKLPIHIGLLRATAAKSNHKSYHHVAVVMKGGAMVATACNRDHRHAEVAALEQLWPSEREGVTVLSLRFTKGFGRLTLGKPCEECEDYMRRHGVKKVVYSDNKGELHKFKL